MESFEKIFNENNIPYNPHKRTKETQVQYLLNKLQYDTRVDRNLYDYFHDTLKDKKISLKVPTKNIITQEGEGLFDTDKIKINADSLNKNILSIRYNNN